MSITGKTAMVTGANRGLGEAIARALAAKGAKVAVCGRRLDAAAATAEQINNATGGNCFPVELNVTDTISCQKAVDKVLETTGRIDILINNAGITRDGLFLRMDEESWDAVIDTNLKGVFRVTKAVIKPMIKARAGSIVNISSIVGLTGNSGQVNYAAAKAALIGFTKSLAKETATRNIRVNAVAPGYIDTDMTQSLSDEQREALLSRIPMGRTGIPTDVAAAVCFLASADAAYITGQIIVVDGGLTM